MLLNNYRIYQLSCLCGTLSFKGPALLKAFPKIIFWPWSLSLMLALKNAHFFHYIVAKNWGYDQEHTVLLLTSQALIVYIELHASSGTLELQHHIKNICLAQISVDVLAGFMTSLLLRLDPETKNMLYDNAAALKCVICGLLEIKLLISALIGDKCIDMIYFILQTALYVLD